MRKWFIFLSACIFFMGPLLGASVLRGRIVDSKGKGISDARLISEETLDLLAVSGPEGKFEIAVGCLPGRIRVAHPGFEAFSWQLGPELSSPDAGEVEIVLQEKVRISDEITVLAKSSPPGFAPSAASTTTLEPANLPENPTALLELLESVPGVSANGQGGLFQVYSIRGVSRHRVTTTILDARLAGDRRAGVSVSFIDPFLFGSVDVLKGPSTVYYGSGSLGGVVRISPRHFRGQSLELGYSSQGREFYEAAGWGNENWSIGFVRKESGDSHAPDGSLINSHFTQYSGLLSRSWQLKHGIVEVSVMPSLGLDIGKASTDHALGKVTEYPYEKHIVANLQVRLENGWDFSGFFHPQSVSTDVNENGEWARVESNSYDSGLTVRKHLHAGERFRFTLGADYFSRAGVDSIENQWSAVSPAPSVPFYSLDGAAHNEAGISGDFRKELDWAIFESGLRFSWARQANGGMPKAEDSAWSGYGGITVPAGQSLKLKGSLGTGLRFPSLSELFYGGTTGRGSVEGNPGLSPERSVTAEGGVEWVGTGFVFSSYLFRNNIENYIERVEVDPLDQPDLLTYRNLTNGTIQGLEWELAVSPCNYFNLVWRGHLLKGSDDAGNALADIPVHRSTLGARFSLKAWTAGFSWQYRAGKKEPGAGEKIIGSATLADGYIQRSLTHDLDLRISGSNLTSEEYFNSADKKVPLSPGRSVSVSLRWNLTGSGSADTARNSLNVR
jgi:iron complex outermembrane receptor protein